MLTEKEKRNWKELIFSQNDTMIEMAALMVESFKEDDPDFYKYCKKLSSIVEIHFGNLEKCKTNLNHRMSNPVSEEDELTTEDWSKLYLCRHFYKNFKYKDVIDRRVRIPHYVVVFNLMNVPQDYKSESIKILIEDLMSEGFLKYVNTINVVPYLEDPVHSIFSSGKWRMKKPPVEYFPYSSDITLKI